MKNILLSAIAVFLLLLQSSCLTSLHPLTTPDTVVKDDRLVGKWETDGDIIEIAEFMGSEPYQGLVQLKPITDASAPSTPEQKKEDSIMYAKAYSVLFRKNDVEYYMLAALTRINNNLYFDLLPVTINDPKNKNAEGFVYTNDYLPTFTMARLEMNGNNSITLHFLNGDFLKEQLRKGNIRIKHEKDELFDKFLVTASSDELRQFITKYGHDERLFSKENSITLTRKG
jgi:hypothetical protein